MYNTTKNVRDFREIAEGRLRVIAASIADDGFVVGHPGPLEAAACRVWGGGGGQI